MLKRTRDGDSEDAASLASYLILLSGQAEESKRVFTCKTCNREFTSFQALGGHRASHKKPRLMAAVQPPSPPKPKTHECSICGQEFAIGQALGGHMRRHRDGGSVNDRRPPLLTLSLDTTGKTPIVKNANSRRVLCLDLNLTPLENRIVHFGKA